MTPFYDEPDRDAAIETLRRAREIGVDFLEAQRPFSNRFANRHDRSDKASSDQEGSRPQSRDRQALSLGPRSELDFQ